MPAAAAGPVIEGPVILLQPEKIIGARIESVDAMAAYIKAVLAALDTRLATMAGPAGSGSVFIAIHGGKRSHAWVGFEPTLSPDIAQAIEDAVDQVPAFNVHGGTVVFALNIGLWTGAPPTTRTGPMPDAWKAAAAQAGKARLDAAAIADRAWAAEGKPKKAK